MEPTIYAIVEWAGENQCSIVNLKTDIRPIVQPSIPLTNYKEGETIQAAYGPKKKIYSGEILELSEDKARLKKLLSTTPASSNSKSQVAKSQAPETKTSGKGTNASGRTTNDREKESGGSGKPSEQQSDSGQSSGVSDQSLERSEVRKELLYLSPRVVETDTLSRVRKLEELVDELRTELKAMKKRFKTMEKRVNTESACNDGAKSGPSDLQSPRPPTPSMLRDLPGPSGLNSPPGPTSPAPTLVESVLEKSVLHLGPDSVSNVVKILARKIFSITELESCSITGKRTVKCSEVPRPALDIEKLEMLERLARSRCPNMNHKLFVESLQNVQKVLRKRSKDLKKVNSELSQE